MADTLATYPYVIVRIGCRLCKRSGSYRLARLAEKYGAATGLEELMEQLAMDCPYRPSRRKPRKYEAVCEARFIDLLDPNPPPPDVPPAMARLRVVGGKDAGGVNNGDRDLLRRAAVRPGRGNGRSPSGGRP